MHVHVHVYRRDIHVYCRADIIIACARGKVISSVVVVVVVVVVDTKSPDLNIEAPERLVSMTNVSNVAKNWLQCAQNRVARPTSVINSAF